MAPLAIVKHLDPVEDRGGELDAGLPFSGVEELGLQASPKGLDHGIVVCVANGAQRLDEPCGADLLAERPRCVLGGFNWSLQHLDDGGE